MGKGTIKSGGTDGLYTIDIVRDTTAMDAWNASLEQRLLDIADEITVASDAEDAAKSNLDTAANDLNVLIDDYYDLVHNGKLCIQCTTDTCTQCPTDTCTECAPPNDGKWRIGSGPCSYLTLEDCQADEPAEEWKFGSGPCTYESLAACLLANPTWKYGNSGPCIYQTKEACEQANDPVVKREELLAQQKLLAEKAKAHRIAKQEHDTLKLEEASIQKQIDSITNVESTIETAAWCADFTEDLTGDVGTVEIPGERTRLLIRPGYDGLATYTASRDGQLQPTQSSTVATVAYNWIMQPGWQKWIPQYRSGTITAIDQETNTCTITFGAETSTKQGLDVNYITASSDIPIEYLDCDFEAFTIGDIVLVEFDHVTPTGTVDNWANPKVIGFIDNPKDCPTIFGYRVQPNPGCETADNDACWNGWGEPFDNGEEPPTLINPPWGTAESGVRNHSLLVNENGWQHWRDPETLTWSAGSGTIDWQGSKMLCGWYGGEQGSRYRIYDQGYSVWYEGNAISVPNAVTGACVREFNGQKYIISICDQDNATIANATHVDGTPHGQQEDSIGAYDLNGFVSTGSFWLFNSAGTEAIQIREYSGDEPDHQACNITSPVWRRKVRLSLSLRVGGGGRIEPDIIVTDLGDEMPVLTAGGAGYVYHEADIGVIGSYWACGPFGAVNTPVNGLLNNRWWEDTVTDSYSYKFYDYLGNQEISAEFWNTREMYATEWREPAPFSKEETGAFCWPWPLDPPWVAEERQSGNFTDGEGCTYQSYPVGFSGDATHRCGVRFTGGSLSDITHEAINTTRGAGDALGGNLGNSHNVDVTVNSTQLSFAVPYMDLRFGQLISVIDRRLLVRTENKASSNPCVDPMTVVMTGHNTWTTTLTIEVCAGGAVIETEERETIEEEDYTPHQFAFWNPEIDLNYGIHRKCRGWHGQAVRADYLFQGPQKDPRPMASAGGPTYCVSYVDRWVGSLDADAPNEHVPPIRSVMNNFPVVLGMSGPFPNAAPVTPVESTPSS